MPGPTPTGGSRPTTLADVAARAGVAVSTVSRALSNPTRVNVRTRERVEQAARELDYTANPSARALSSGRTGAVAVLVSDVTNPFYFDIIRGSQQQLKNAGVTQLLVDTEESAEVEASLLATLQRSCDGAILTSTRLSDSRLDQLAASMNLVTINRPRRGIGSVVLDTAQGMEQAVEHLVSLGHRRIVYVSGPKGSWSNERRWRAVHRAARRLGADVVRTRDFPPRSDSGTGAADAVLNTRATACIAYNDVVAIGMLARLAERGVAVPEDLSVVGCDDIFGADFCHPPLTTVTAPVEHAGRVATSILLSGSASGGPATAGRTPGSSAVLPTHLTVRRSTGAPRAAR
ncbi:LacI family transcriptional regulator [Friedmanniella endophytica]|uniref:LacI family transcriptional regulator n=1 Tax=Microlunatus kandeliicorticis TaxID=1759536 RepID=A0A7W3IT87_9ACTN|nr:LacI family DNA-binding transcriptional regulator [Microlunatus kandeliicorticis]MBA8794811.1 LacI family transcriptional regulator [Microlunatus kandeliicorticis]